MKFKTKIFLMTGILALLSFSGFTQTRISSPYSRYGLGDLQNNKYLRNNSMGGISFGYRSPYSVNYANPASLSGFDTTSFVFETGVNSQISQLKTKTLSQTSNYTTLSYLVMGFPVTKWWGASIGLLPYSSMGYKIADSETKAEIGKIDYQYEGEGGLNQFYIGNGFRMKNFSFGFNTSYIFGYLDKARSVVFPDSASFLNIVLKNTTHVNDFLFTGGLQYKATLKKDLKIVFGLVYNLSTGLNARQDSLAYTFRDEGIKDTIISSTGNKGSLELPQGIGAGFTIGKADRWLAGIDYQTQNWSKYSAFGETDSLRNSWAVSVGAEITPKSAAISSYWKRVHYRLGARYNQTYLSLHNNKVNEYAVSFGFGLPLKRSKTTVNLGFELGQRGTTENNLIKEQFGRVILSLSVYEYWFIKRRFD